MSDPVQLGTNVLFFSKADLTRGKGLKLANQRGVAVCTRRFLFMIPSQEVNVGAVRTTVVTRGSVQETVEALVQRPDLTVEGLEHELANLMGPSLADQVFEIEKLAMFKVWTLGPLSQVRMKLPGGIAPIVFVPRGKGAVKQVKAFYA